MSSKLQLRLPIKIARQLSIHAGDEFYWRVSDDTPGVLQLVPAEVVERRYAKGETLERLDVEVATELEQPVEPAASDHPSKGNEAER